MAEPNTKRRYFLITGNDNPPLTCPPEQLLDMLPEFIGHDIVGDIADIDPMKPVTITETWLTDAQYEALGDWSP